MENTDTEIKRMHLLMPMPLLRKVEDWRRKAPNLPNMSEAIRQLIEDGLEKHTAKKRAR